MRDKVGLGPYDSPTENVCALFRPGERIPLAVEVVVVVVVVVVFEEVDGSACLPVRRTYTRLFI